jgi:hypothetical protein
MAVTTVMMADTRANLLRESPELYQISKEHDQAEMDMMFGTNEDGSSKYIRMPDGNIYPNTAENRATVAAWQQDVTQIGEQREEVAGYIEEHREEFDAFIDEDGNIDHEKLLCARSLRSRLPSQPPRMS